MSIFTLKIFFLLSIKFEALMYIEIALEILAKIHGLCSVICT